VGSSPENYDLSKYTKVETDTKPNFMKEVEAATKSETTVSKDTGADDSGVS